MIQDHAQKGGAGIPSPPAPEARANILIVDDIPGNIEILGTVLGELYDITIATSGMDALSMASSHRPEMILLDVLMPDMDGFEVCRRLRADTSTREIPVIFLTTLNSTADEVHALEQGAVDFLSKPINPPVVMARVKTHLELARQRRALHLFTNHLEDLVAQRSRELVVLNESLQEESRERQRSEEKLRFLFENIPDHLMVVDRMGTILYFNRATPAPFPHIAPGLSFLDLFPHSLQKHYRQQLEQVFQMGHTGGFLNTGTGDSWWEFRLAPLQWKSEPTAQALIISTDITEKRALKMQVIHNARLASIGVLAASVAHEINNPNNNLRFAAASLSRLWQEAAPILQGYQRDNGDYLLGEMPVTEAIETAAQLLKTVRKNSERIKKIVEHLKHSARKDEGRMDQEIDIHASLQSAVVVLQNEIIRHTEHFTLEDSAASLPKIRGNPQQLEQVWINLIHNALQTLPTRDKGVCVTIELSPDENMLLVLIRDDGPGIPESMLQKIMDPFFTTKQVSGGLGLGLSITKTIIEGHGGHLRLESTPGAGTTAMVSLPIAGLDHRLGRNGGFAPGPTRGFAPGPHQGDYPPGPVMDKND
ncbi:MAG: response regulator [Magnetococcus sp. MYC-9]